MSSFVSGAHTRRFLQKLSLCFRLVMVASMQRAATSRIPNTWRLRLMGYFLAQFSVLLLTAQPAQASGTATATTLTVSSEGGTVTTVTSGSMVTLSASVAAGSTAVTVGRVNFCDAAASYCTDIHLLGTAQLTKSGTATFKFRPRVGSHSFKAIFAGTNNAAASTSSTAALTVTGLYPSVTGIVQSGSAGNYTLVATVGGVATNSPTRQVSFLDASNNNSVLGTATLSAGTAGLNFLNSATVPYTAVEGDSSVVIGDFNGDGIPDLAATYPGANALTVLLGNGDGTFTATSASSATGSESLSIAAGDFNGDGALDVVVANYGSNTVTVLLGNGDGTFTATSANPATGSSPISIVTGDFNGDGILDIAVANEGSNTVTVLLGNGDGTFTAAFASPATGSEPQSIATGDFNGDGSQDLAVANYGSNTVTVLLGHGDGTFTTTSTSPATGSNPTSIAVGDFNGDGIQDLAIGNASGGTSDPINGESDGTITILLGVGDGTFTATSAIPATGGNPSSIAVGDFNGDGIPDLAVSSGADYYVADPVIILLSNGNGTFTSASFSENSSGGFYPGNIVAGDLNGDGISDLVEVTYGFYHGSIPVLSASLTETQTASATITGIALPLATGSQQVVASYSGDSSYKASTSMAITLASLQSTPTVTVTASAQQVTYGTPETLTATVTGSGLTPTGTVIFSDENGQFGTGTLNSSAVTTYTTSAFAVGTHSITARYQSDSNYTAATSAAFILTVNKGTPTVAVTPSSSSISTAQALTVAVAVSSANGTPTPTGSVMLSSGNYTSAATTLSSGNATVSVPAGSLGTGADTLTVSYTPDPASASTYTTATQSATVTVTGTDAATVTVTPAASTITNQQSVSVAVTLTGSTGQATPTGALALTSGSYNAQQTLSGGTATFSIPAGTLSNGANTLTVTYAGDGAYHSSTGTAAVTVSQVVLAVPAPAAVAPGASTTATATFSAGSTYAGTLNLTCTLTSFPAGAQSLPTCSLNPASVTLTSGGSGTTVLTVKTTAATSAALVRPSLWGLGGGGAVLAAALMLGIPARRRRSMSWLILLGIVFTAGAIGCGGSSNTTSPPGSSTSATTAGNYTFTVAGTDSANSQITTSAIVSVTVQ